MEKHRCTTCRRWKPASAFNASFLARSSKICRACKAEYNRSWYRRNKETHKRNVRKNNARYLAAAQQLLKRLKSEPCADCGRRFPPVAMDFDHVSGVKREIVSRLKLHSQRRLLEEIAKCEVVCAVCHRIRTARRLAARGKRITGLEGWTGDL